MRRLLLALMALMALQLVPASKAEAKEREREPLTRVHAIGGGYHLHWLTSDLTGGMRFHGPAVGYSYDLGRTVRFMLHGKFFFPVVGRMDNDTGGSYSGRLRSDFDTAWGVDGTLAVGRKFESDGVTLIFGGGVHLMGVRLNSAVLFPVESITMGVGALARLRWSVGKGDIVQVGIDGQFAADFFSLLRQVNPVNLLITGTALGTLGFKF